MKRLAGGILLLGAIAAGLLLAGGRIINRSRTKALGATRLVSVLPLSDDGEMCQWKPASSESSLFEALEQQRTGPADLGDISKRRPIRTIHDPNSAFSAVAVDPIHNEVVMTDENLFSIMVYDRLENTPPTARMSEPKRLIRGASTDIEYQCSLYVDPKSGDIYAVNNDTLGKLVIFSRNAKGDTPPDRFINTPHTTFGVAVDEKSNELMLAIQDDAAIVTYAKTATGDDPPIRLLQGIHTGLADPHGLAVDSKRDLMYVSNWGSVNVHVAPPGGAKTGTHGRGGGQPNWPIGRNYAIPGSGTIGPPSITIYARDAKGDTAPIRKIEGPKTQLDWPTALAVNPNNGELYVANDPAHSILVFDADARGDVAPIRVLKGPKTLIRNPTGVYYDEKNDELWVANFGNHTATVYKPTASGDTPPLRVIRTGPADAPAPMMGNPNPVTWDSKRDELLVAN